MHNIFHVSLLHPYLPGGTLYGPPNPIVANDNQENEIERIVPYKKTVDRTIYYIRWIGSDTTDDSWLRLKIWPMLLTTCELTSWVMEFDLFDLLLTSGDCRTFEACPELCRPPCLRECVLPGACFWPVRLESLGWGGFFVFCYLLFGLSPSTPGWVLL